MKLFHFNTNGVFLTTGSTGQAQKSIYDTVDFWLDTVNDERPKLIDKNTFFKGMDKASSSPFRVVPFRSAPWGGQWMKEVCDLDRTVSNFGWCFDCVPEENSLLLKVKGIEFEMPSINLVYTRSKELLGEPVEARFGKEFPIRFDILIQWGRQSQFAGTPNNRVCTG